MEAKQSFFLTFSLFAVFLGSLSATTETNATDFIRASCSATLYPDVCHSSLYRYASTVHGDPYRLARVAISVSLSRARRTATYVFSVSRQADYGGDSRTASALHDCFSNFGDAVDEIRGSMKQMRQLRSTGTDQESFRFQISNVQTWMSAALTDEETCTDGLEDVEDGPVKSEVMAKASEVTKVTSNALALVNRYVNQ